MKNTNNRAAEHRLARIAAPVLIVAAPLSFASAILGGGANTVSDLAIVVIAVSAGVTRAHTAVTGQISAARLVHDWVLISVPTALLIVENHVGAWLLGWAVFSVTVGTGNVVRSVAVWVGIALGLTLAVLDVVMDVTPDLDFPDAVATALGATSLVASVTFVATSKIAGSALRRAAATRSTEKR